MNTTIVMLLFLAGAVVHETIGDSTDGTTTICDNENNKPQWHTDTNCQREARVKTIEDTKINATVAATKQELETLKDLIEELAEKLVTQQEELLETKTTLSTTNGDLSDTKKELSATKEVLSATKEYLTPVGSIVAWMGAEYAGVAIPTGWQLCDGSLINDGPMKGNNTVDLNGEGRFLRGGESPGTLQDDAVQNHKHTVSDPGHTHTDSGHKHQFYYTRPYGHMGDNANDRNQAYPGTDSEYTEKGKANIQKSTTGVRVGDVTSARKNVETRPKNMAILWIIRIF